MDRFEAMSLFVAAAEAGSFSAASRRLQVPLDRFVYERPVHAGDVLQVVVHVEDVRVAAGNDLITTRAEVRTPEAELVATAFATTVVRGPDR